MEGEVIGRRDGEISPMASHQRAGQMLKEILMEGLFKKPHGPAKRDNPGILNRNLRGTLVFKPSPTGQRACSHTGSN